MAIQFIDNQPITFKTSWETDSECKTSNDRACTLYSRDDYMFAQFKQTPCGNETNLFCDPPFTNDNPELIVNGDFSNGDFDWTLDNATHDAVNNRVQFSSMLDGDVYQHVSGFTIGTSYTLTFTLGGATNGYIYLYIGGDDYQTIRYTNGTYTLNFVWNGVADDILAFYTESNIPVGRFPYNGWIDNISLKETLLVSDDCWQGTPGDWLIQGETSITKVATTATVLVAKMPAVQIGDYVRFKFTVSGMTQGTILVKDTLNNIIATVDHNGEYEAFYTVQFVAEVNFFADEDFNGTLSDFSFVQFSNSFTFLLTDGTTSYDLSSQVEYYQDWVTLKADVSGINEGCYQLVVYDACGYNITQEIVDDINLVDGSKWSVDSYGNCNVIFSGAGNLRMEGIGGAGDSTMFVSNTGTTPYFLTTQGYSYVIDYEIETAIIDKPCIISFGSPDNGAFPPFGGLYITVDQSNTTYSGQFIYQNDPLWSSPPYFVFTVTDGLAVGERAGVQKISFIVQSYAPGQATPHYSNCIEVREDTDCTKWVAGTNGEDSYGFHFDNSNPTPFQLGARVRAMLINPKYPGDLKRYSDARGRFTVTRGESTKSYTLFIDYTDEHTHDWLRLATHCDTINVGYSYDSNDQYVAIDGDYEPEWPSNLGNWPAAQARVEIQKKVSTLYNNNAG